MNKTIQMEDEIFREVCNNRTMRWINIHLEPRKMVDHVEGYVIVAVVFMIVLAFGAPRRRQSQSIVIRYAVEGVFVLSLPLFSYTLGLMQGQVIRNVLYPVWAMFLVMLFGGTNAMSVQKLEDNKHLVKLYVNYILSIVYIISILPILDIVASKPSPENGIRWLARYMKQEHQLSPSWDPRTMRGYKYMILIHSERHRSGESAITLDKIWCGNIGILSSSDSPPVCRLKDICLSFALFHLVVRRYFGYTCPESKLDKTRVLVLHGLLRTEEEYGRAFNVIETELAFLYDFFFTKYAFIMYGNEVWRCALPLTLTIVSIAVGTWCICVRNTGVSFLKTRLLETSKRDVVVTWVVLGALSIFQLLQILSYYVSDWAKVSLVCKYATNPSWQGNACIEKLLWFLGRPHKWLRYWRNNLGQYSVLDSVSSKHFLRSGKSGKPVELSMELKNAVACAIRNSITGHLSNGSSALMRRGMSDELSWACQIGDEFTLTHIILVWHLATSYCEISDETYVNPNLGVATSLSKYVAYLVAFAPTLLPGSPIESECTLDELEEEAAATIEDLVSPRGKYERLRQLHTARETSSGKLLSKGVLLGKALEIMENPEVRWELLAEFWAEMLVYIAPSNNVAGHIELLPQGGEFLTHVWAMLMHAGILERPAAAATAVP